MKSLNIAIFCIFLTLCSINLCNSEDKLSPASNFVEKTLKQGSFSVSVKPNPKLKSDKKTVLSYSKNVKCKERAGVLNHLKLKKGNKLKVSPSFISVTPDVVNVFSSYEPNSLRDSVKLVNIERITQLYLGTNCFDIQSRPNAQAPMKIVTLCGQNEQELNEWIAAILDFKKCNIAVSESSTEMNKTDIHMRDAATVHAEKLSLLRYPNKNPAYKKTKNTILKDSLIKSQMKGLLTTVNQGNAASRIYKRKWSSRLANVKTVSQSVIKQEEEIRQALERRTLMERRKHIKLIRLEHKNKEIKLIKEAQEKIRNEKLKELEETKKHYTDQINYHRLQAKKQAYTVLKLLKQQNRLEDWSSCKSNKLYQFQNKRYVNKWCKKHYGENAHHECYEDSSTFCIKCCQFYIGVSFIQIKEKCLSKCKEAINGKKPLKKPTNIGGNKSKAVSKKAVKVVKKN